MFLAMNRFKIVRGHEETFIDHWRQRESYLDEVPGFLRFHLLKGPQTEEYTLFSSYSEWESAQSFEDWTHSESFRKAHANAGKSPREIYLGPPQLELFDSVL
ncbi:antibiotic biosynthesis monooxygenase [Pseudomonas sp. MAP12]|uniref:Antibiotic biosynthesis monooxygenase n=1 Tax=Geopseudomonas aromaticivorans TaxID=2849492 RepID=A0ABS6MRQ9_9GAMM|nr:antibiotic biosynthesis monooxygenase [Pseudomonas aromaticivorans]MBV2131474.1 antibiotic biosynthesis monooxygenase [Pseudomonas aromaticivorans]